MKRFAVVVITLALLAFAGVAWAQSSTSFRLSRSVIAGGGARSVSAGYRITGTAGQGLAGPPGSASSGFGVNSGFWVGSKLTSAPDPWAHRVYLPLVQAESP